MTGKDTFERGYDIRKTCNRYGDCIVVYASQDRIIEGVW